jgi:hypothetical protein
MSGSKIVTKNKMKYKVTTLLIKMRENTLKAIGIIYIANEELRIYVFLS